MDINNMDETKIEELPLTKDVFESLDDNTNNMCLKENNDRTDDLTQTQPQIETQAVTGTPTIEIVTGPSTGTGTGATNSTSEVVSKTEDNLTSEKETNQSGKKHKVESCVTKGGTTINKLNVADLPRESKRSKSHRALGSNLQVSSPPGLNGSEQKVAWSARGTYTHGRRTAQIAEGVSRLRNNKSSNNNAVYQWKRKGEAETEDKENQRAEEQTHGRSKKILMEKGTAAQVPLLLQMNRCENIEAENRLLQEDNAKLRKSISALGKEVSCLETAFQKLAQVAKEKLPPDQAEVVKTMITWAREDAKNNKKKNRKKRRNGTRRKRETSTGETVDKQDITPETVTQTESPQARKGYDNGIKATRNTKENMPMLRQPPGRGKNGQQKKQSSNGKRQQNDTDENHREMIRGRMRDAVSAKSLKGLEEALTQAKEKGMDYEVNLAQKKIVQLKEAAAQHDQYVHLPIEK